MAEKILFEEQFDIIRKESNFDRACEEAYDRAIMLIEIDEDGHSRKIKEWERSSCHISVSFDGYERTGGMGGHTHSYTFLVQAVESEDEDEEDNS
jgi:hypothetical protein